MERWRAPGCWQRWEGRGSPFVFGLSTILQGMGRVRDVREGPDGFIYVALEARGDGETPIVRLEPLDD